MNAFEKFRIRTFGPRTVRTRTPLFVSLLIFGGTIIFVGVASAGLGLFPSLPSWISFQKSQQSKVEGITVSQIPGNCPAKLITDLYSA